MNKQVVRQAILERMAIEYAKGKKRKWKESVKWWKLQVERCGSWRGTKDWWAWVDDWNKAKRKLAEARRQVVRWSNAVKDLTQP